MPKEEWGTKRLCPTTGKRFYDLNKDPNEFHNLASDAQYFDVIQAHQKWLPRTNLRPVAGSANRVLIYENGTANWEGEDISPEDAIPD